MSCWKRADEEAPQETLNWTHQMKKIKDHFESIEQTEEQDKEKHKAGPQYNGQKIWHRFEDKEDLYIGDNWTQIEDNEIIGQVMREGEHGRQYVQRKQNMKLEMEPNLMNEQNKTYQLPLKPKILTINILTLDELLTELAQILL